MAAAILLVAAIIVRLRAFGNPVIQIDEEFYLLVGGRMWQGLLPYVDIFDRKPIGLFLIYALARAVPGDGVVAYQLLALACVWGTALLLFTMARGVAPFWGAIVAAILYLAALDLAGGEGGQAPVFYNLAVAAAALIALRATRPRASGSIRVAGIAAMTLIGVAMQVKYSVVFEGVYLGCVLLAASWRRGRRRAVAVDAAIWIGCAVAPTLIAAGVYAAMGKFDAWWFANITSIVSRRPELPATIALRIRVMAMLAVPGVVAIVLRRWLGARPDEPEKRADLRFIDGWAAVALLGVVLFGTWFNHYALPLFAPFAVAAAPLWSRRKGQVTLVSLLGVTVAWGQHMLLRHETTRGDASVLDGAVAAARPFNGCAFVYDGMPAFYDRLNSCFLTTRPFPAHLQSLNEVGATGIDQPREVARVMATHPQRVMTMEPAYDEENLVARAALYRVLRREYVVLYRGGGGMHRFVVYGRIGTLPRRQ